VKTRFEPGPIACEGALVNDFGLTSHLPPHEAPAVIDRDRLHMAARPGFNRKLLPLGVDPATGAAYSGGRYLFDTYENAVAFGDWVANGFELDGTMFVNRPDFIDVELRVLRVLGAHDFKDVHSHQHVCRAEFWSLSGRDAVDSIASQWPSLRDEAADRGCSSLWLVHDDVKGRIGLVTVAERVPGADGKGPDFRSVEALASQPSLGARWESSGRAQKVFDRSHWVFNIWFPRVAGLDAEPALWPNSPPLPGLEAEPAARKRA